MDRSRLIGVVIVMSIGLVWLLQGVGVLPGSFMSRDPFWAVLGGLLVGLGATFVAWQGMRRNRS